MEKIKWEIDFIYTENSSYRLDGSYKGTSFYKKVRDNLFGLPLKYAKWCITRRLKILYPELTQIRDGK